MTHIFQLYLSIPRGMVDNFFYISATSFLCTFYQIYSHSSELLFRSNQFKIIISVNFFIIISNVRMYAIIIFKIKNVKFLQFFLLFF